MRALVTGASGGIGRDMAIILSRIGYDLILVARNENELLKVRDKIRTNCIIITADLADRNNCIKLYNTVCEHDIDILINNAGYGIFGEFPDIELSNDLDMIDLNIVAVDILTKLFLKDFIAKDKGFIMNVASSAAFLPGPLLSSYYASKAYVLRLTEAIYEELRRKDSSVNICALCPGPVDTGFNKRAGVKFKLKGQSSYEVASYALDKMFEGKLVITPGLTMKLTKFIVRFIPDKLLLKACYHMQKKKI